ncbi:hypothetical protein OUZ56_002296 [Daphnia magna]|uniref:Uncharacterized protein n=1 Tax=Daphnia magna TaxID=35525 RepID=A0ABR0A5Q0_9CRUS|nr:hypothetical protein OUZ56_002296 [Daphnia magna]
MQSCSRRSMVWLSTAKPCMHEKRASKHIFGMYLMYYGGRRIIQSLGSIQDLVFQKSLTTLICRDPGGT